MSKIVSLKLKRLKFKPKFIWNWNQRQYILVPISAKLILLILWPSCYLIWNHLHSKKLQAKARCHIDECDSGRTNCSATTTSLLSTIFANKKNDRFVRFINLKLSKLGKIQIAYLSTCLISLEKRKYFEILYWTCVFGTSCW